MTHRRLFLILLVALFFIPLFSSKAFAQYGCGPYGCTPTPVPTYHIDVYVFQDANRNGILDPGETLLWAQPIYVDGILQNTDVNGHTRFVFYSGWHNLVYNPPIGYILTTPSPSNENIYLGPSRTRYFGLAIPPSPNFTPNPPTVSCSGNNPTVSFSFTSAGATWFEVYDANGTLAQSRAAANSDSYTGIFPVSYSNSNFFYSVRAFYDHNDPTVYTQATTSVFTFPNCYYTITANVFVDNNRNTLYDAGDTLYPGASVNLSGDAAATQSTDNAGNTAFPLLQGHYTVALSIPAGYTSITPSSYSILLNGNYTAYFAIAPTYTIGGSADSIVYIDHDRSNSYNAGDGLYSGASVTLTGTETYTGNSISIPGTTNGSGQYSFSGIYAGSYTLTVIPPTGYTAKTTQSIFTVPPTPAGTAFGIIPLYEISGDVFNDRNKDGLKAGDPGMANPPYPFTVRVTGPLGTQDSSTQDLPTSINGFFTTQSLLYEGDYTVTLLSSLPPEFKMTYPTNNIGQPQFSITVGRSCTTHGIKNAYCSAGPAQSTGSDVKDVDFGMSDNWPWCQIIGADGRDPQGHICNTPPPVDPVGNPPPNFCPSNQGQYTAIPGSNTSEPGILFSGNGNLTFPPGTQASTTNWQVGGNTAPYAEPYAQQVRRTSYSYMTTTLRQSGITPIDLASKCAPSLSDCTLPNNLDSGIYQANGDVTFNSAYTVPIGKQYIIIINGNLNIKNEFHIAVGSSVTFSVSGNITVDKTIGETNVCLQRCDVEGWFSTDQNFIVDGYNSCANYASDESTRDKRLNICGGIVTNAGDTGGSLVNNRDLCDNDKIAPSYSVILRTDLLLNAPEFIKFKSDVWQEIAP